jgi:hypothetical protein
MGSICASDTRISSESQALILLEKEFRYNQLAPQNILGLIKRRAVNGALNSNQLETLKADMRLPKEQEFYQCFKEGDKYREMDLVIWALLINRASTEEVAEVMWGLFDID